MADGNKVKWLEQHLLIVGCLIFSVVMALLVAYKFNASKALVAETKEARETIEKMRRNSKSATNLEKDIDRIRAYSERVEKSLVNPAEKAANLAYFYDVAVNCNINLLRAEQRVQAKAEQTSSKKKKGKKKKGSAEPSNYGTVHYDIGLEGDFLSIMKFMDTVGDRFPLMRIETISISPSRTGGEKTESADMLIAVPFEKPETK